MHWIECKAPSLRNVLFLSYLMPEFAALCGRGHFVFLHRLLQRVCEEMSGGYNSPGADAGTMAARMQSVSSSSIDREEGALGSAPIIGVDVKK